MFPDICGMPNATGAKAMEVPKVLPPSRYGARSSLGRPGKRSPKGSEAKKPAVMPPKKPNVPPTTAPGGPPTAAPAAAPYLPPRRPPPSMGSPVTAPSAVPIATCSAFSPSVGSEKKSPSGSGGTSDWKAPVNPSRLSPLPARWMSS